MSDPNDNLPSLNLDALAGEAQTPALAYAGAAMERAERHFRALGYALDDLRRWSELVRAERERAVALVAARRESD